jgi:hypothetical protein
MHNLDADAWSAVESAEWATASYRTWRPGDGVPIRTTVGECRWWRGPELEHVRAVTPYGVFGKELHPLDARVEYQHRLEERLAKIVVALADVARRHRGERLVLLCFEDVWAGEECHRRWLAEWMETRFWRLTVPELHEPPHEPDGQLQLDL